MIVVNPQLLKALDHYANGSYDLTNPTMVVITDETGRQVPWTVEQTCSLAAKIISNEELSYLKLKQLKEGLGYYHLNDLYERIMHEKL